jgi:hypothetical protein
MNKIEGLSTFDFDVQPDQYEGIEEIMNTLFNLSNKAVDIGAENLSCRLAALAEYIHEN